MTDKEKDIPGEADPSSGSIQLMIATRKTGTLLTISLTAPQHLTSANNLPLPATRRSFVAVLSPFQGLIGYPMYTCISFV